MWMVCAVVNEFLNWLSISVQLYLFMISEIGEDITYICMAAYDATKELLHCVFFFLFRSGVLLSIVLADPG